MFGNEYTHLNSVRETDRYPIFPSGLWPTLNNSVILVHVPAAEYYPTLGDAGLWWCVLFHRQSDIAKWVLYWIIFLNYIALPTLSLAILIICIWNMQLNIISLMAVVCRQYQSHRTYFTGFFWNSFYNFGMHFCFWNEEFCIKTMPISPSILGFQQWNLPIRWPVN